jgi:cephalosporin-C deacetylase-like acetyl esterase
MSQRGTYRIAWLLMALCALVPVAAAATPVQLVIATDRADGSYGVGETVTWTVRVPGGQGNAPEPAPAYTVSAGTGTLTSGTLAFTAGVARVTATCDKPGVLVLTVAHKTPGRPNVRCGAAIAWQKLVSTIAEPADFDAFWKAKLAEQAAIPMNPVLEAVDAGAPDVQLWKITMDTIRGARIHGYLARPTATGTLPAQLQVQYWGVYPLNKKEVVGNARKGWLAMNIMAHDLPCDRDAAFYKNPGISTYVNAGADDREKSYFLRMFLACARAVDFLADRSDWNRSTLLVQGGSQGGFQGIATAALNPRVTALTVFVPGGGNLTGFLEGQPSGWPGWVFSKAAGAQREAMIRTAGYYDAKNFARRIRCPVLVGTGLIDTISPPETQFVMFNNLAGPKRMVLLPADDHIDPHTAYKAAQTAWWKAAAAGAPVPME